MSSRPKVPTRSRFIDGFQIPDLFLEENFRSALDYQPRDDDLFIATYPKCGTTWTQQILALIFRQGQPIESIFEFFSAAPFLEISGSSAAESMPRPGAIKVHLPYHMTPRSSSAKYIYVTRNPKDCCVSFYHHMKDLAGHGYDGDFNDFFEVFLTGEVDYGDYFDHLLGWYEHRNDSNILFMTYEEMKEQPEESILKMASFIDDEQYAKPLREDPEKLKCILKFSSFNYMKVKFNEGMDQMFSASKEDIMNNELLTETQKKMFLRIEKPTTKPNPSTFIRKGVVGDWKTYLNEDQNKRFNEKIQQRLKGTDLETLWRKYI